MGDGTRTELGAWFEAEYGRLIRFAYAVSGDRHLAEDLVQEAYVRVSAAGPRDLARTGAYVRRAIVNLARGRWRRLQHERRALSLLHQSEEEPATERDDQVWQAIRLLPARQRAVIALRFYEDLHDSEIARVLGIGEGSVRRHSFRGVQRIREIVREDRDES